MTIREDLRNVAIVAHVDHGKTTLVDAMLWQSGAFNERDTVEKTGERVMDSGDLEREKGITILAKNTAVHYRGPAAQKLGLEGGVVINVIDTPGHADFGGEVERGLSMVDGVVLLVDSSEGPLPQTRFVLRKALQAQLPVVIVVNKVDRPDARIEEVVSETQDLLLALAEDLMSEGVDADVDSLLDVPVVYASAKAGKSSLTNPGDGNIPTEDLEPLFETILHRIPGPEYEEDAPLQAHVTNLDASPFLGRLALLRIHNGTLRKGETVGLARHDGSIKPVRITELLRTEGLERIPAESAEPGDIVAVAGIEDITIGESLVDLDDPRPLPLITVDDPAISMTIGINTSPMAGRVKGAKVTARQVKDRLDRELVGNVSLRVLPTERPDAWEVQGRGELALAILVEQMRREGFELTVGKPQVVTKTIDGVRSEPMERMTIDIPEEYLGSVTQLMAQRKGRMETMANTGSLVADRAGQATPYAMTNLQERGSFIVEPGSEVYEGQVVGENPRGEDMDVNICREKKQTNTRSATADVYESLTPSRKLTLEESLEFAANDECVEVTPEAVRVRKVVLDAQERFKIAARERRQNKD